MANTGKGTFQPDSDVHISYEDQQKINKFARLNAKVDDYKDELKVKQNDMKNLEEAVEELSLADDSEKIPYLIGEVFICQNLEDTLEVMENTMDALFSRLTSSFGVQLTRKLNCIKEEIKDMKDAMNFMNEKCEEVLKEHREAKNKVTFLEEQNSKLNSTVKELNSRLNSLEQSARSNNIEIQCVPERKDENLSVVIGNLGGIVNCKVGKEDISYCTRVAKMNCSSDRPRDIVVQFNTARLRDEFMAAVIKFNKSKPLQKLNTAHLGISGKNTPIYVMDHLSPTNRALHAATRSTAKERENKYVWIRKGLIYVRKTKD